MGTSLFSPWYRAVWLEFLRQVSGNARVGLSIDSSDPSQRRSNIVNQLFPRAGRANRPILEHRAYAGGTFQQFRHAGAAAIVGWPVRTSADVRLSVGPNLSHAACQRPVDLRQFQAWIPSNGEIRELAPQSHTPRHGWKILEFGSSCCLLL